MILAVITSNLCLLDAIERATAGREVSCRSYSFTVAAVEDGASGAFVEWPLHSSAEDLLEALRRAQFKAPPVQVVVLLPRGLPALLHRAIAAGAADVLLTPVDATEVAAEIDEILGGPPGLRGEKRVLFERLLQTDLIGISRSFRSCLLEQQQAASCDANVFPLGETGTGKEMFARAIHRLSSRASEPYIGINYASLPANLLESELFGHVKGAFTGADRNREGRFGAVRAGTLLLDEVGDIEPALQMKLLRVIKTREFERVGENTPVKFNGRLVAATSVDIDAAICTGRFRRDLMGRLDQFRVELPPLRQRREDIPILTRHFIVKHSRGRPVEISPSAMDLLQSCHFPMNIRQLENAIVGAIPRCFPGTLLLPKHLPAEILQAKNPQEVETHTIRIPKTLAYEHARAAALDAIDAVYLAELLRLNDGNQSAAADAAGIDRKTFAARWKNAQKGSEP